MKKFLVLVICILQFIFPSLSFYWVQNTAGNGKIGESIDPSGTFLDLRDTVYSDYDDAIYFADAGSKTIKQLYQSNMQDIMGTEPYIYSLRYPTLIAPTPPVYGPYVLVFDQGVGLVRVKNDSISTLYANTEMEVVALTMGYAVFADDTTTIMELNYLSMYPYAWGYSNVTLVTVVPNGSVWGCDGETAIFMAVEDNAFSGIYQFGDIMYPGDVDDYGQNARFANIRTLLGHTTNNQLFVLDQDGYKIKLIDIDSGAVSTLLALPVPMNMIAVNLQYADRLWGATDYQIYEIFLTNSTVMLYAGNGMNTFINGAGTLASFTKITGLLDTVNGLWVTTPDSYRMRTILANNTVSIVPSTQTNVDIQFFSVVRFENPIAIDIDDNGDIAIADCELSQVIYYDRLGGFTTIGTGEKISRDGWDVASFKDLKDVAFGTFLGNDVIYVLDDDCLRLIFIAGNELETLLCGYGNARRLAIDPANNIYFVYPTAIIQMQIVGGFIYQRVISGSTIQSGDKEGFASDARYMDLQGITVDPNYNIFVSDSGAGRVRVLLPQVSSGGALIPSFNCPASYVNHAFSVVNGGLHIDPSALIEQSISTVSFWFYGPQSHWSGSIFTGYCTTQTFSLVLHSSGAYQLYVCPTFYTFPGANWTEADDWVHITLTYNSSNHFATLYLNGNKVSNVSITLATTTLAPICFNFGKACGIEGTVSAQDSFADIYVFNSPLSDDDITSLYTVGTASSYIIHVNGKNDYGTGQEYSDYSYTVDGLVHPCPSMWASYGIGEPNGIDSIPSAQPKFPYLRNVAYYTVPKSYLYFPLIIDGNSVVEVHDGMEAFGTIQISGDYYTDYSTLLFAASIKSNLGFTGSVTTVQINQFLPVYSITFRIQNVWTYFAISRLVHRCDAGTVRAPLLMSTDSNCASGQLAVVGYSVSSCFTPISNTCPVIIPPGNATGQYPLELYNIEYLPEGLLSFILLGPIISQRTYSISLGNCGGSISWYRHLDLDMCQETFLYAGSLPTLESICQAQVFSDQDSEVYSGNLILTTEDVIPLDFMSYNLYRVETNTVNWEAVFPSKFGIYNMFMVTIPSGFTIVSAITHQGYNVTSETLNIKFILSVESPFKTYNVTPIAHPSTVSVNVTLIDDCLQSQETSSGECDQLWGLDISHSGSCVFDGTYNFSYGVGCMSGKSCETGTGTIRFHISSGSVCKEQTDAIVVDGTIGAFAGLDPQDEFLVGDEVNFIITLTSTIDIVGVALQDFYFETDTGGTRDLFIPEQANPLPNQLQFFLNFDPELIGEIPIDGQVTINVTAVVVVTFANTDKRSTSLGTLRTTLRVKAPSHDVVVEQVVVPVVLAGVLVALVATVVAFVLLRNRKKRYDFVPLEELTTSVK